MDKNEKTGGPTRRQLLGASLGALAIQSVPIELQPFTSDSITASLAPISNIAAIMAEAAETGMQIIKGHYAQGWGLVQPYKAVAEITADFDKYLPPLLQDVAAFRKVRDDIISGTPAQKDRIKKILADVIHQKKLVYIELVGDLVAEFPEIDTEITKTVQEEPEEEKQRQKSKFIKSTKELFKNLKSDNSPYMNIDYVHVRRRMRSIVSLARVNEIISEQEEQDFLKNIEHRLDLVDLSAEELPSSSQNKKLEFFNRDAVHALTEIEYFFQNSGSNECINIKDHNNIWNSYDLQEYYKNYKNLYDFYDHYLFLRLSDFFLTDFIQATYIHVMNIEKYQIDAREDTKNLIMILQERYRDTFGKIFPDVEFKDEYLPHFKSDLSLDIHVSVLDKMRQRRLDEQNKVATPAGDLASHALRTAVRSLGTNLLSAEAVVLKTEGMSDVPVIPADEPMVLRLTDATDQMSPSTDLGLDRPLPIRTTSGGPNSQG